MSDEAYKFDVESELNRKTLDALGMLEAMKRRGDITPLSHHLCLITADSITRGLVDGDISEAIDSDTLGRSPSETLSATFINDSAMYVLCYEVGTSVMRVTFINRDNKSVTKKQRDFSMESGDGVKEAYSSYLSYQQKLLNKGFERL